VIAISPKPKPSPVEALLFRMFEVIFIFEENIAISASLKAPRLYIQCYYLIGEEKIQNKK